MPYSMPLCTIFTKWPAPLGPQWRYPRSLVPPSLSRPAVFGIVPAPGASVAKIGIEPAHNLLLAADHETVAALESHHPAARAAVHVVHAVRREPCGARDVVAVVRVAAVDHDVVAVELREQRVERGVDDGRRDHQPDSCAASAAPRRNRPASRRRVRPRRQLLSPQRRSRRTQTHSCPPRIESAHMFPPMRPNPIIPTCIVPSEGSTKTRAVSRALCGGRASGGRGGR